jgi:hypothetical protein
MKLTLNHSDDNAPVSVSILKDRLAGLSQFTESKALFSMHINMTEKCMEVFKENKLLDLASVEQASP